jgi:hypothetical protein
MAMLPLKQAENSADSLPPFLTDRFLKNHAVLQTDRFKVHIRPQNHRAAALGDDLLDGRRIAHPGAGDMGYGRPGKDLGTHER